MRVNLTQFEKRMNEMGLSMADKVVGAFIANGILDLYILSQQDVPILTGFLASTGTAEMTGPVSGRVFYDAPYALPQHDGWLDRAGKFHKGKHYLQPKNADKAFKVMVEEMSKFYRDVASGLKTASSIPDANVLPVTGASRQRGRPSSGIHRFTQARVTATGKKSFQFRGPAGRFTRVFRPGLGKAQRQAGKRVRIGGQ